MQITLKRVLTFGLAVILSGSACSPSDPDLEILATVDDIEISRAEFRKRAELNPRLRQYRDPVVAKERFLSALIAEKLLARSARSAGAMPNARESAFLRQIERETVIEALYTQEIYDKVTISPAERSEMLSRARRRLRIRYAAFTDRAAAASFSALPDFSGLGGPAAAVEVDSIDVNWATADPELAAALYALKPGEHTAPLPARGRYYVAQLVSEDLEPHGFASDAAGLREKVDTALLQQKRKAAFIAYYKTLMQGRKTRVPPERFKGLLQALADAMKIGEAQIPRPENPAPLTEPELRTARGGLQDLLDGEFIRFADGTAWTVGDFLERLSVGRFYVDFTDMETFRRTIRNSLVQMVEQEYLYKEGVRAGLHETAVVRDEISAWQENQEAHRYLALLFPQSGQNDPPESLRSGQIDTLTAHLGTLAASTRIDVDENALANTEFNNAGVLLMKRHFPGRLVVPVTIPLENHFDWRAATDGKHSDDR